MFIEQPTSLFALTQTYSANNTVKFLLVVSPTGAVNFVFKRWGGRLLDKYLTAQSGFLSHLQHEGLVLTD